MSIQTNIPAVGGNALGWVENNRALMFLIEGTHTISEAARVTRPSRKIARIQSRNS